MRIPQEQYPSPKALLSEAGGVGSKQPGRETSKQDMDADSPHAADEMQPDRFVGRTERKEKRWERKKKRAKGRAKATRPNRTRKTSPVPGLDNWRSGPWVFALLFPTFFHPRSVSIISGICLRQLGRVASLGSRKG